MLGHAFCSAEERIAPRARLYVVVWGNRALVALRQGRICLHLCAYILARFGTGGIGCRAWKIYCRF